jgi:hypothetical protein
MLHLKQTKHIEEYNMHDEDDDGQDECFLPFLSFLMMDKMNVYYLYCVTNKENAGYSEYFHHNIKRCVFFTLLSMHHY